METNPQTIYFSKLFLTGLLKGIVVHCKVTYPSLEACRGKFLLHSEGRDWHSGAKYRIVDRSFQNYVR